MYSPFCYHLLTGKSDLTNRYIIYPLHNRGLNSTEQDRATASTENMEKTRKRKPDWRKKIITLI